jgi:hypothetical protein
MTRRREQQTFAAVVAALNPPSDVVAMKPGLQADGSFIDRTGRVFALIDDGLSAADVSERASEGALIVWGSCGCGGFCDLTWLPPAAVERLTSGAPPKVPRKLRYLCEFSEWRAKNGSTLVLVQGPVEWGFDVGSTS